MQVFMVNDCEWWAGSSAEEVLDCYMRTYKVSHEEATGDADEMPIPLSDEEMLKMVFHVEDEDDENSSFRDALDTMVSDGAVFPCFFATTEW